MAVVDKNGEVVLWDMYIDGVWHGSKRTEEYVRKYFAQRNLPAPTFHRDQRENLGPATTLQAKVVE